MSLRHPPLINMTAKMTNQHKHCVILLSFFALLLGVFGMVRMDLIGSRNGETIRVRHYSSDTTPEKLGKALLDAPLPCARVSDTVRMSQVFPDQKLLARKTITERPFWISSHDAEFDELRWRIVKDGVYYEDALTQAASNALRDVAPGMVLDVGANIGWLSLVAASFNHEVIAFEPNPANQMRLCQSIMLNGWDGRLDVYPYGVSDVAGTMTLRWAKNPGGAKLQTTRAAANDKHAVEVSVVTLDEVLAKAGFFDHDKPIYFMKVDVESFEPAVFRGAKKLLESGRVLTILHEMSVHKDGKSRADLRSMLRQLVDSGYVLRDIEGISTNFVVEVKLSKDSEDGELDDVIATCGKHNHCDLVWDHGSISPVTA
jgi:FkbM family methyltransferase